MTETIYTAMGGADAVGRLAEAWHERCLADPIVEHAFSHGYRDDHTERLAAYWAEQLGGPTEYSEHLGSHAHVLRLHAGNGPHPEMDANAERCFAEAMDDARLPDRPELRAALTRWFHVMTVEVDAYPDDPSDVPEQAPLPTWSWSGRVTP